MSLQMMKRLCELVGVPMRNADVMDLFLISGRIINDPELRKRKTAMVAGSGNCVLPDDADEQIIASMPPADLAALRVRVQGE
jgi:hypothetical protein